VLVEGVIDTPLYESAAASLPLYDEAPRALPCNMAGGIRPSLSAC